jgi:hypothetical protein
VALRASTGSPPAEGADWSLLAQKGEEGPPGPSNPPWSAVTGKPAGFADDVDNDALTALTCVSGQVAQRGASAWICGADPAASYVRRVGDTMSGALSLPSLVFADGTSMATAAGSRLVPDATSPSVVGGVTLNTVTAGVLGGVVVGGGTIYTANRVSDDFGTVAGGLDNIAGDDTGVTTSAVRATVGGGYNNRASASSATVAGGSQNRASGSRSVVGGGQLNQATAELSTVAGGQYNAASGSTAAIIGGQGNTASGQAAVVGGGIGNQASGAYAFVGGGGGVSSGNRATGSNSAVGGGYLNLAGSTSIDVPYAFVGGGDRNTAGGRASTVAGGDVNTASGDYSTVAGGAGNTASGYHSVIAGGGSNSTTLNYTAVGGGSHNSASGDMAVVSGGDTNSAGGYAATVPGGQNNGASGFYSLAAGRAAKAQHTGAFVWADSTGADYVSFGANTFAVRATGGVRFHSSTGGSGVELAAGAGAWSTLSDVAFKRDLRPVDGEALLSRLSQLPLYSWRYRDQAPTVRHLGPTAQDFAAAFGLGENQRHISTVDADGVALAAIQALARRTRDAETLKDEVERLRAEIETLRQVVSALHADVRARAGPTAH